MYYWTQLNVAGFLLMGFAFVPLLAPMTLNTTAKADTQTVSLVSWHHDKTG
jgi:hypothetical protein